MDRQTILKVLKEHGWSSTDQTEALSGVTVLKGSSFDEMVGVKASYTVKEVKEWLGY